MKTMGTWLFAAGFLAASNVLAQESIVNLVNHSSHPHRVVDERYDSVIWASDFVTPRDRHLSAQPWASISEPRATGRAFVNRVTDEGGLVLFSWGSRPKADTRLNADRTLRE